MATWNYVNIFVDDLAEGVHTFATEELSLGFTAADPTSAATVMSGLTPISTANMDDVTFASVTSTQTGGTYTLDAADQVITATGTVPTFRYVILYNSGTTAKTDPIIGYWDYGSDVDMASGETLTVSFDTVILTVAPAA